jgi:IclR family acetate operon transcriptional repressor
MTWLGKHLDLHCTALGKALASSMPSEEWQRLTTQHKLARHNDATICSPGRLIKELTLTRERGYAFDNEEFDIGMRCLAVPVLSASGEPVAAIGVSGTTLDIQESLLEPLVRVLKTAAARIADGLGGAAESEGAKDCGDARFLEGACDAPDVSLPVSDELRAGIRPH